MRQSERGLRVEIEVGGGDRFFPCEYGRLRDHVAKFAYIARPGKRPQGTQSLVRKAQRGIVLTQEMFGDRHNILDTLPQRWNPQLNLAQTMVQIAPEPAGANHLLEILIGRRDNADI